MHTIYALPVLYIFSTIGCLTAQRDYGLCSQVFQMHQYCTSLSSFSESPAKHSEPIMGQFPDTATNERRELNYTEVEKKLEKKFEEFEKDMREKFQTYEKQLNETMAAKLAAYENTIAEIEKGIETKMLKYEKVINQSREMKPSVDEYEDFTAKINEHIRKSEKRLNDSIREMKREIMGNVKPSDCRAVMQDDAIIRNDTGGIFEIHPMVLNESINVYCDLTTDGGGWTVLQRRMDGSTDFFRSWSDYVKGFGDNHKELWLGLELLHKLTKEGQYELRVDLQDWHGNDAYAKYGYFSIGNASENYKLSVGEYTGNAGDSLAAEHNGREFSARGKDFDTLEGSCVKRYKGGWWYSDCYHANLNGIYYHGGRYDSPNPDGVVWYHWRKNPEYSLKFVEMKFRRKFEWSDL